MLGIEPHLAKRMNEKVTLYHDSDWTGQQFDVRSLKTCVKVVGPLYVFTFLYFSFLTILVDHLSV